MCRKCAEQAIEELRAAEVVLQPGLYHVAVRQAHFATELALKAVLWRHEEHGVRGHNIVGLLDRLEMRVGTAPRNVREGVGELQAADEVSDYPDASLRAPLPQFDESDALRFISLAREVLTWIDEIIEQAGNRG